VVALAFISYIFRVFIEGAVAFISEGGAVIFIDKGSLAVEGRLFKTAEAGVNRHDLRQRLITYKLKGPSAVINSLISTSDYSIGSSS
jgi:predicted mannosyl-3-phosphoglycerate phosphatase (HAD superfamily)